MPGGRPCASRGRPFSSEAGGQGGFTFVELLVSLVLLSVLGLVVWSGLLNADGLVRRTIRQAALSARVLQLDTFLRRSALRVRVPYWQTGLQANQEPGKVEVPWLDGEAGATLTVELRGEQVIVGFPGEERFIPFGPFPAAKLGLYKDASGQSGGIELTVTGGREEPVLMRAPFGGHPFPRGGGP